MPHLTFFSEFWSDLSECIRLLYWAYFKPLTFERWLHEIDPNLGASDNPLFKKQEFAANLLLRRYAYQSWWLIVIIPVLAFFIRLPIYSLAVSELFDPLHRSLFLLGWVIGLGVVRKNNKPLIEALSCFAGIMTGVIFLSAVGSLFFPNIIGSIGHNLVSSTLWILTLSIFIGVAANLGTGIRVSILVGIVGALAGVLGVVALFYLKKGFHLYIELTIEAKLIMGSLLFGLINLIFCQVCQFLGAWGVIFGSTFIVAVSLMLNCKFQYD